MKLLFENWRRYISEEEVKKKKKGPPPRLNAVERKFVKRFKETFPGSKVRIEKNSSSSQFIIGPEKQNAKHSGQEGIKINKQKEKKGSKPCTGLSGKEIFNVAQVDSSSELGPFYYDIGLELASIFGGGLAADSDLSSPTARITWQFYYDNRSDVDRIQLDIVPDQLDRDTVELFQKGEDGKYTYHSPNPGHGGKGVEVKQTTPDDPSDDCHPLLSPFKTAWYDYKDNKSVEGVRRANDPTSKVFYKKTQNILKYLRWANMLSMKVVKDSRV